MNIKGNTVVVEADQQAVFDFLKDSNNLLHVLPQDKISDFQSTDSACSFKVQGGIIISLEQNGAEGINVLHMKSGEKSPFPFELDIHLKDLGSRTEGYIEFNGKVNAFLKMMVEKPLRNLFNYMADKLQSHFSA